MASSVDDSLYAEIGEYLLKSTSWHDCHFLVGWNRERIGAVKCNLINQSGTWWSMLSPESPVMENGDISLPDIEPDVFRLLLKHSYGGLEDCDQQADETMMKLCYCADKYFMTSLMEKIATRLQPSMVNNLFPALHCLVYYNLRWVEPEVRKLVQTETTKIFQHPEFLECDVNSVTYIAKQNTLNCDELELWKAVITWAKHKVRCHDKTKVRGWLLPPLQHIRFLTLSMEDIHKEVFTQDILDAGEMVGICKEDVSKVGTLSNNTTVRGRPKKPDPFYRVVTVDIKQNIKRQSDHYMSNKTSCSCIILGEEDIYLLSLTCKHDIYNDLRHNEVKEYLFGKRWCCNITLTITRITNHINNTSDEGSFVVKHNGFYFSHADRFSIPTTAAGDSKHRGILLQANGKYKIQLEFDAPMIAWSSPDCHHGHHFQHGTFFCSLAYNDGVGLTAGQILEFSYRVAYK